MVFIHFKREKAEFLVETSAQTSIEEVLEQICTLHNARERLARIATALEGLAEFGVLRPEAVRGLTAPESLGPAMQLLNAEERAFLAAPPHAGQVLNEDKTGWRCGRAPAPEAAAHLRTIAAELRAALDPRRAEQRRPFTAEEAATLESLARGAAMIAYPAYHGLPPWDPLPALLERPAEARALFPDADWLEAERCALWWAKKELLRGRPLAAFIGANEKTKIVAKVAARGQGAPVSEPPVDRETHLAMLSFYHRRQEEERRLAAAPGEEHLASAWADPKGLKGQLVSGGRPVAFRPPAR